MEVHPCLRIPLSERGRGCWDTPKQGMHPCLRIPLRERAAGTRPTWMDFQSSESGQNAAWLYLSKFADNTHESLVTESRVWDRWGLKSGMAERPQLVGT